MSGITNNFTKLYYDKWEGGKKVKSQEILNDPIITETFAPLEQLGLDKTLDERGSRYGSFIGHAAVTQDLKNIIKFHLNERNKRMANDQQEALDMICHKIGRIVNNDADYADSWHDIAGYASLVDNRLNGDIL